MPLTIGLSVDTIYYLKGAGHFWAYLNWALGLKALGHRVIWIESVVNADPIERTQGLLDTLRGLLQPWGLADSVAVAPRTTEPHRLNEIRGAITGDAISGDLLIALQYCTQEVILRGFKASGMIDIDPGLTQMWVADGDMTFSPYTHFFTIGEGVVREGSQIPKVEKAWIHTPPAVALEAWPMMAAAPTDAPLTTISHWYADEWVLLPGNEIVHNDKQSGFKPFLDLPKRTTQPLELAISMGTDQSARTELEALGWRVKESHDVTADVDSYQRYIRHSRGEFSCAKPMYVRFESGWISDRTICYLASGRPCVVQHTGPSDYLPDAAGLFRFKTLDEAKSHIDAMNHDYDKHARLARQLAEEYFDSKKVCQRVIERSVG